MTIASSSGLSGKEIKCMVVDVEQYAEQDKACRDVIEESNKAEPVCADTEKGENIYQCLRFPLIQAQPCPRRSKRVNISNLCSIPKSVLMMQGH